jgi:hypothetical protein
MVMVTNKAELFSSTESGAAEWKGRDLFTMIRRKM